MRGRCSESLNRWPQINSISITNLANVNSLLSCWWVILLRMANWYIFRILRCGYSIWLADDAFFHRWCIWLNLTKLSSHLNPKSKEIERIDSINLFYFVWNYYKMLHLKKNSVKCVTFFCIVAFFIYFRCMHISQQISHCCNAVTFEGFLIHYIGFSLV